MTAVNCAKIVAQSVGKRVGEVGMADARCGAA